MSFPRIRRVSKLGDISPKNLIGVAVWFAFAYGLWLVLRETRGEDDPVAMLSVIAAFSPLAFWALYDYRFGLMLAVVAGPLLIAPTIPHGFTQGFGDLFAACAVLGYFWRHPRPSEWKSLWRREYVWLILIVASAAISVALSPARDGLHLYGVKYGIAEIAGLALAGGYLVVLVGHMRDRRDVATMLYAVVAALSVVLFFSMASLVWSTNCIGGYGKQTALTVNGAVTSTFSNPNYAAGFLLAALPFVLWSYTRATPYSRARCGAVVSALFIVVVVQATLSRMGLVGLIMLCVGWIVITRWRRGTRMVSVVFALALPITIAIWWFPTYNCDPTDSGDIIERIGVAARASKGMGGDGVSVRIELAKNALAAWRDHPVTGVGTALLSNYSSVNGVRNRAHNIFLTVLAEQGLLGVAVWSGWLVSLLAVFWRQEHVSPGDQSSSFLLLAFCSVLVQAMFMDHYRVIWIWQLSALVLSWGAIATVQNKEEKRVS